MAEEEVPFSSTYMKFSYSKGLDPSLQDPFFYFLNVCLSSGSFIKYIPFILQVLPLGIGQNTL